MVVALGRQLGSASYKLLDQIRTRLALDSEGTGAQCQQRDDGVDLDHVDGKLRLL